MNTSSGGGTSRSSGDETDRSSRAARSKDLPRSIRDQYDWVVVGEEPGALLSACLVARLGLSVLILSTGKELRVRTSRERQILDLEPNWISGLAHQGVSPGLFRQCLMRIGLHSVDLALAGTEPLDLQVLSPQVRVRLGRSHSDVQEDLEKELGLEFTRSLQVPYFLSSIERMMSVLWDEFPNRFNLKLDPKEEASAQVKVPHPSPTGKPSKKSKAGEPAETQQLVRESVAEFIKSKDIQQWIKFLYQQDSELLRLGIGQQDFEDILGAIHWVTQGKSSPWESEVEAVKSLSLMRTASGFQGGRSALKQMLLRAAQKNGAHVSQGRFCKRIFSDRGKLTGVQLSNSGNVIGAAGLILGVTLDEASTLLSEENRTHSALRSGAVCQGWLFSISLLVPKLALPPGATSFMVYSSRDSSPLIIELSSPDEFGADPTDLRLVFIRCEVPFESSALEPEYLRVVASRMIQELDQVFPGLVGRAIRIYPDYRMNHSSEIQECYPYLTPREIPDALRIFSRNSVGSVQSGIEGMFLGTRESLPGFGDFASVVSAIEASAWIAQKNGIPKLFP